ncbi:MAG: hypothetical protein ABI782_13045 [Anaerolineaceae bacterium]
MADCEQVTEDEVIEKALDNWAAHQRSLYAVVTEDRAGPYLYNWIPQGDYGLIYRSADGFGLTFHVASGLILGAGPGCMSSPGGLLHEVPQSRVIVGPTPGP